MSIKVRCKNCRKKIAIDEGFAGGLCRCPYCGALAEVPARPGGGARDGLPRPARPGRPEAPGAAGAGPTRPAQQAVPMAKPVLIQGIVAIVLLVLLVLMLSASGVFFYMVLRGQGGGGGQAPPNPITASGQQVAGMPLRPPVVYILDGGSGTGPMLDPGAALIRHSVRRLERQQRFNIFFVKEGGFERFTDRWAPGGVRTDALVKTFLSERVPAGATDLVAAIEAAFDLLPRSVVVLTAKPPAEGEALAALTRKARAAGIRLYGVSLGGYGEVNESMRRLAEQTGGAWRGFSLAELVEYLQEAPPLP